MFIANRFRLIASAALLSAAAGLAGCGSSDGPAPPQASISGGASQPNDGQQTDAPPQELAPVRVTAEPTVTQSPAEPPVAAAPEVLIKTSLGTIRVRLDAEKAPQTVQNFLDHYANRGFYEQTIFHYVEQGFMIAGGGYTEQFEPKPVRTPVTNESNNGLSNVRGTIAMARDPEYAHTATSQFYINLVDNTSLDHQETEDGVPNGYCVFGNVVEGMDVVDRIAQVAVSDRENFPNTPVEPVVIESVEQVVR